jgi:hypothetical protein
MYLFVFHTLLSVFILSLVLQLINQSINRPIIRLRNIGHPQESSTILYSLRRS